jgi:hypothetical protein
MIEKRTFMYSTREVSIECVIFGKLSLSPPSFSVVPWGNSVLMCIVVVPQASLSYTTHSVWEKVMPECENLKLYIMVSVSEPYNASSGSKFKVEDIYWSTKRTLYTQSINELFPT